MVMANTNTVAADNGNNQGKLENYCDGRKQ